MNTTAQNVSLSIADGAVARDESYENIRALRDYGFTHITFGYQWRAVEAISQEKLEKLREYIDDAGLKVSDVHGPHPRNLDVAVENETDRQLAFDLFRHRLKLTHFLGGDAMVYHVPTRECDSAKLARYVDGLQRLEDEARELGLIVALENHYIADIDKMAFAACFEKFDADYIGFTFDTGHANKSGNTAWLLENCMDRLSVLHLNDNDGKGDLHWEPYRPEGTVNWQSIIDGIAKSPYRKPIQLEVGWKQNKHATREDFLTAAAAAGKKIREEVTKKRGGIY